MNEDSKALYHTLVKEQIIPQIKEENDNDLTQEDIHLIGTYLDKEIESLTQEIDKTENVETRKMRRKARTVIKKHKKKMDDYSQRKAKY